MKTDVAVKMRFVCWRRSEDSDGIAALKKWYSFIDWNNAKLHTMGFSEQALKLF
jgi:hypothetical protein